MSGAARRHLEGELLDGNSESHSGGFAGASRSAVDRYMQRRGATPPAWSFRHAGDDGLILDGGTGLRALGETARIRAGAKRRCCSRTCTGTTSRGCRSSAPAFHPASRTDPRRGAASDGHGAGGPGRADATADVSGDARPPRGRPQVRRRAALVAARARRVSGHAARAGPPGRRRGVPRGGRGSRRSSSPRTANTARAPARTARAPARWRRSPGGRTCSSTTRSTPPTSTSVVAARRA
jgi:hypothetical protein